MLLNESNPAELSEFFVKNWWQWTHTNHKGFYVSRHALLWTMSDLSLSFSFASSFFFFHLFVCFLGVFFGSCVLNFLLRKLEALIQFYFKVGDATIVIWTTALTCADPKQLIVQFGSCVIKSDLHLNPESIHNFTTNHFFPWSQIFNHPDSELLDQLVQQERERERRE